MFENTYVGKFWRKPKNSISPENGFVFELSGKFTGKCYVEKKFDFGFGFSTIKLGKEN